MRHSRLLLAERTLKDVREAAARVTKALDSSRDAAGPLRPLAVAALLRVLFEYPLVTAVLDKQTQRLTARCENLEDRPGGPDALFDLYSTGVGAVIGAITKEGFKEFAVEASGATDPLLVMSESELLEQSATGDSAADLLGEEAHAGGLTTLVDTLNRLSDFADLNQAFSGIKVRSCSAAFFLLVVASSSLLFSSLLLLPTSASPFLTLLPLLSFSARVPHCLHSG